MKITTVTPWFNHMELADDFLRALTLGPPPDETIVIDNGSSPRIPFATIRNATNLGFSPASNQGLKAATGDIVVFLNSDVTATETDWLVRLVAAVEPGVLVGAMLRRDAHANVDGYSFPYLDGWCLAGMRTDLIGLGGFDETLEEPAYWSDNLLCLEARAAGMTLREARVGLVHKLNGTAAGDPRVPAASAANRARYERRAREILSVPA